jgi:hypothetical protein
MEVSKDPLSGFTSGPACCIDLVNGTTTMVPLFPHPQPLQDFHILPFLPDCFIDYPWAFPFMPVHIQIRY